MAPLWEWHALATILAFPAPVRQPAPLEPIAEYLPLVWRVARKIARRLPADIEAAELVGAGTIGLVDAMSRYEVGLCDRFSAYAEIRIRGAILDQLREMDWMPRSTRTKRRRMEVARTRLHNALGRSPDVNELAAAMGVTAVALERMRFDIERADVQRGFAFDEANLPCGAEFVPGHAIESRQIKARLAAAIEELPAKYQRILTMYYLDDLKLREIGELLGVTESRVCQLHREIIGRLRMMIVDA